jgi:adenylosuccinate lyase
MRLFSSPSEVGAASGDAAWLRAMLDFEGAFAGALAEVGLADAAVAEEIAAVCAAPRPAVPFADPSGKRNSGRGVADA